MKKIAFVLSEMRLHEQLSIMSLSASLKKAGHETSLIYLQNEPMNKEKLLHALKRDKPDIIALSFMSSVKDHYIELATYIKHHLDVPIIIGGPAATFDPTLRTIKSNPFDAVCVGEGDLAIVEFANNYERGNGSAPLHNFYIISDDGSRTQGELLDLVEQLDDLPFPDRRLVYEKDDFLRNSKVKMFMSGRGCPYKCTYCFNHKYNKMYSGKGHVVRHKSVDYFLEEILRVKKEYPLDGIIFEDDIFILDKSWIEEFSEKYARKIGLPYMCYIRPNLVTVEIAKLLKKSRCYSARVAIECGNESIRNKILKRNLNDEQILRSCRILHDENIKVGTINILGLPTETVSDMQETLNLNRMCKPDHVSANLFIPLPGVDLTLFAIQQGLLDESFSSSKSTHHMSEMRYPEEVKKFLYSFKSLFPLLVRKPGLDKTVPYLVRFPGKVLKAIDSGYRLCSNMHFYPPVRFSIHDKLRALRRYMTILSS